MSHILTKEKVDEQFELFLKESVSDDSGDLSDKQPDYKGGGHSKKATVSLWQDDEHEHSSEIATVTAKSRFIKTKKPQTENEDERGLFGSEKSVKKCLRKSQAVEEDDDNSGNTGLKDKSPLTRESSQAEAVNVNASASVSVGVDTLMEDEEKAQFFGQFEAGASSNIDYRQLNKEMDITSSTTGSYLRIAEESVYPSDDEQKKGDSPCLQHYSEDFEDEDVERKKLRMSPIIGKVSFDDSHDDLKGQLEDRGKEVRESLDRGLSYAQTAGSDMEALHNAYRQINTGEDLEDLKHHYPPLDKNESIKRLHSQQAIESPPFTNESELSTAEELMRLIRPVSSAAEHGAGENFYPLDRTFPSTQNVKPKEKSEKAETVKCKGAKTSENHQASHPEHLNLGLTWSIREEVDRLMEEQTTCPPHTDDHTGKAKKEPNCRGCPNNSTSASSVRKPIVVTPRIQKDDTKRLKGVTKNALAAKTQSSISRVMKPSLKTAKNKEKEDDHIDPGVNASGDLVVSVQSLVDVLKQQIGTSSRQEVTDGRDCNMHACHENDISVVEELRDQLAQKVKELQIMKKEAEELKSVQQENYCLQSKLLVAEEASKKMRLTNITDPSTEKSLQQIRKEIQEQETIIQGYQQENEKIYLEMKAQQAKSKANEHAMFKENQRLQSELVFTREQLSKSSCSLDQRIKDLLAHINTSQMNEAKLSEDIHRLKQENQALLVDMELIRKERDVAKMQSMSTAGGFPEDKLRMELAALKKEQDENQEVRSRDAERLKAATVEIQLLKEQVDKMKAEVSKRSSLGQKKVRAKPMDIKRMQDLERQVKQLEQMLRSRNPNLSAVMYGQENVATSRKSAFSCINTLLERRIQRIEAEMERHDEEAKQNLCEMEQQFQKTKRQYEHRISELEQQLKSKEESAAAAAVAASTTESWMSQIEKMKVELEHIKEAHDQKENILQDQIETLKKQLKHKAPSSPGRNQQLAKEAHGIRITQLNQKLAIKTQAIQELTRTVERLQKERRNMLSGPNTGNDIHSSETKQQPSPVKSACSDAARHLDALEGAFPAAQSEKTYQPTAFTGSHISEVLQENEALRERLKRLELNDEREKEALKSDVVKAKEELCRQKDLFSEEISSLKAEHLKALEQMRGTYATEHSSSKVAHLTNVLNTREIMVKLLQDQLKELQGAKEALAVSRTREGALEAQLSRLLKELKDAKDAQSPEVKLLCSLEAKIGSMEQRHQHREKELQQIVLFELSQL
ncbi:centrosomal protein of 162 kDa isoform X2 [Dunckerocampus dactyliophorus]|uniref:centrosomal protein of 162 kDa isoform X2 n=1 Tax=Dunckerocampus dactyliophorus TaxID=161453 RepID=UPI0024059C49|nr:centrosomal protein of 162 kDa isoform X2 [Dunckerocampus dactyliophorus]